jgi:hypothetical protein
MYTERWGLAMHELSILNRELTRSEEQYLKLLGWRGKLPKELQRLFLALREECDNGAFGAEEQELFAFFLQNPEEASWVLGELPKRSQPFVVKLAALDHYIQLNGSLRATTYYAGPRRAS